MSFSSWVNVIQAVALIFCWGVLIRSGVIHKRATRMLRAQEAELKRLRIQVKFYTAIVRGWGIEIPENTDNDD